MTELFFIRHGKTYGNTKGRYIGCTDEPLCEEGKMELLKKEGPVVDYVFHSPMRRCYETAEILYPGKEMCSEDLFREMDFGMFENKNYLELSEEPFYQSWINSNGTLPIPGGEDTGAFKSRCQSGFRKVLGSICGKYERVAFVLHGGTIMSILEAFGEPKRDFYGWQLKNAEGYRAVLDEEALKKEGTIRLFAIEKILTEEREAL